MCDPHGNCHFHWLLWLTLKQNQMTWSYQCWPGAGTRVTIWSLGFLACSALTLKNIMLSFPVYTMGAFGLCHRDIHKSWFHVHCALQRKVWALLCSSSLRMTSARETPCTGRWFRVSPLVEHWHWARLFFRWFSALMLCAAINMWFLVTEDATLLTESAFLVPRFL